MKKIKISYIKLAPVIGLGYWKESYGIRLNDNLSAGWISHNFIIPFFRIQLGILQEHN